MSNDHVTHHVTPRDLCPSQDEFDAIPDSPTPTEELHRSTSDPIQSSANTTITKNGNSKYPTIQNNNPGQCTYRSYNPY